MSRFSKDSLPPEWVELVTDLETSHLAAHEMGGTERLEKRSSAGKLNARERIELLVDPGSFCEIGSLVGMVERQGLPAAPADALVGAMATIDGRPVVVGSEDATVQGGSIGLGTHSKRLRLADIAHRERVPLIMLLDGAGERVSNSLLRHPYCPNDMQEIAALSHKVPTIAAVLGASAGHGAITALLADIVIMSKDAAIFAAGPPLVAAALGEIVTKEALGGPEVHAFSGVVHNIAETEHQALALVREYLSYLPTNAWAYPPEYNHDDTQPRPLDNILHTLPRDGKRPYDTRDIITELVDRHAFLEFSPDFGATVVAGLAHLGGRSIAVVANQPSVMGGAISRDGAEKAAYFISLADAYHLPVVFLADNPGVMSGSAAEKAGTLRAASRMFAAQHRLSTPKLHVTLRKAYGFGSSLMGMNPFDKQTISYAFPGITLGGVPASGGGTAAKMSADERTGLEKMEREGWRSIADTLAYDEVIDPRDLRDKLLSALQTSRGRLTAQPTPKVPH